MVKTRRTTASTAATAPQIVVDLVNKFTEHRDTYTGKNYNEVALRHDFLNPFFEALGWDVTNRQGYSEAYRDVVLEPRNE